MNKYICEFPDTLNEFLCEDIIEKFETYNTDKLVIPKKDKEWMKIEKVLYKELLLKLNEYKNRMIMEKDKYQLIQNYIEIFNKKVFLKDFVIQKIENNPDIKIQYYRRNSRYNEFTFVFYLNHLEDGGGELSFEERDKYNIQVEMGKLVIFPDDIDNPYVCQPPKNCSQYIISGQLCSDNHF
jgi:hypothetical protein